MDGPPTKKLQTTITEAELESYNDREPTIKEADKLRKRRILVFPLILLVSVNFTNFFSGKEGEQLLGKYANQLPAGHAKSYPLSMLPAQSVSESPPHACICEFYSDLSSRGSLCV